MYMYYFDSRYVPSRNFLQVGKVRNSFEGVCSYLDGIHPLSISVLILQRVLGTTGALSEAALAFVSSLIRSRRR